MFSVDLSIHECGGRVVVGLREELDVADATSIAALLAAIAASQPQIIVDLAAPRQQVLRVLAGIRLIDGFHVHPSVDEAAGAAAGKRVLPAGSPDIHQPPATAATTHQEPP